MKIQNRLVSIGLAVLGLAAAIPTHADFNERNQLTQPERAAICLIESFLSAAAAAVEANKACPELSMGTLMINAKPDGNATGSLGAIRLESSPTINPELGTRCLVTQIQPPTGTAQFDFIKLKNFVTTPFHDFSPFGDVFSSVATLTLTPVTPRAAADVTFNERNIKNFVVNPNNPNSGLIRDDGREVIRKGGYSASKWVQKSVYARNGIFYRGSDDYLRIVKARGVSGSFPTTPEKLCTIEVEGSFTDVGGVGAEVVATLTVRRARPVWP